MHWCERCVVNCDGVEVESMGKAIILGAEFRGRDFDSVISSSRIAGN
jgi:hypothetical protein